MRCAKCPMYSSWSTESDYGEACRIFGDAWDSGFQYEDKMGNVIGCYLDRHFIEKEEAREAENIKQMAEGLAKFLDSEPLKEGY